MSSRKKGSIVKAEAYMRHAIALAKQGIGAVDPNPLVGAVIVKDGRIIGEGYHERFGQLHAERNALANCTEDPKGATMYVTASPCIECAKLIIQAGIKRVVYSEHYRLEDGIELLKRAGIEVVFVDTSEK